jgi:hypothetical protein
LHRPAPGALLFGDIGDHVDKRLAGRSIDVGQHLRRYSDEIGVEVTVVPLLEYRRDAGWLEPGAAKNVVCLRDELHVGVLDTVVDHFDEVARPVGPHVGAAGLALELRGDVLKERSQCGIGLARPSGHDARAVQGTFLPA